MSSSLDGVPTNDGITGHDPATDATTKKSSEVFTVNKDEAIYNGLNLWAVDKELLANKPISVFNSLGISLSPLKVSLDRSAHDEAVLGKLFVNGRKIGYYEIGDTLDLPVAVDLHLGGQVVNSLCIIPLGSQVILIDPRNITDLMSRAISLALSGDKKYLLLLRQLLETQKLITRSLINAEDPAGTLSANTADTQASTTEVENRKLEHVLKDKTVDIEVTNSQGAQVCLFAGNMDVVEKTHAELVLKMAVLPADFPHPIHLNFLGDGTVKPLSSISGDALVTIGREFNRAKVLSTGEEVTLNIQFKAVEADNPNLTKYSFKLMYKGEGKYILTLVSLPENKKVVES